MSASGTGPSDPVTIRAATVRDFDAVSRLLAQEGRPAPTPETRGALQGAYERHLARSETASRVARLGTRVVGFCALEFRDRLNRTAPEAWIPDLVVAADVRGRGVGRALLEAAQREALKRRATRLVLDVDAPEPGVRDACKRAGFTEKGRAFAWVPGREHLEEHARTRTRA